MAEQYQRQLAVARRQEQQRRAGRREVASTAVGMATVDHTEYAARTRVARRDEHACSADRQRLHRSGGARVRRAGRHRRRTGSARGVARRAHVERSCSHGARPGRRPRRARRRHGERVAIVSHNSARLLTSFFGVSGFGRVLVPINFRLNADEIGYIVEHSGASVLLVDPELDDSLAGVTARHRYVLGKRSDDALLRFDARARAVDPGRGRDRQRSTTRAAPPRARRACSSRTATSG